VKVANGQKVAPEVYVPHTLITRANVDKFIK